jgi:hypothetical protein|tara:strand:+ start:91 stop:552 length:462 start_codon:yes stop_codon:yes gene_type:complete
MAATQALCNSFKAELLQGYHKFQASGGSAFKLALYTSSSSHDATTANYSTTAEISNTSGSAYVAAGLALTNAGVTGSSSTATSYVDFANAVWNTASFTANSALLYNTTANAGTNTTNAVCVLAFGADYTASNGTFTVQFPTPGTSTAILRISG